MALLSRSVPELEAISLPFELPTRAVAPTGVDGAIGALLDQRMAEKGSSRSAAWSSASATS
jgi:TRAP-type C4-dicarboxylate transport system substrate-binding protein